MALHILARRNYGGESLVSIKYYNLHSFKEGVTLLCQSILKTKEILQVQHSALFTIPLMQCPTNNKETGQDLIKKVLLLNIFSNMSIL